MKKDTTKLLEELQGFSSFESFFQENETSLSTTSLGETLKSLIEQHGLTLSQVVENSEMSEVYAYQILSGIKKHPKREKVLCLAFGIGLSCDETQELLKITGYAPLYAKRPFDAVVLYGLYKRLSVVEVNNILFEYGQGTLG